MMMKRGRLMRLVLVCLTVSAGVNYLLHQRDDVSPECKDRFPKCSNWAARRQCLLNTEWMRENCAASCGVKTCSSSSARAERYITKELSDHVTEGGTLRFTRDAMSFESFSAKLFHKDVPMVGHILPNQQIRESPFLTLSNLGTGTYLGPENDDTDQRVVNGILRSIGNGWNVIDTASNYRNGRGEKAVGEALRSLLAVRGNGIRRCMIFISTKVGFVSSEIMEELLARGAIRQEDVVRKMHCIHPECIRASLAESLRNMHIKVVDLLYLHNVAEILIPDLGREVFFGVMKSAFHALEDLRKSGLIKAYGMATWDCFRVPTSHHLHVSLEEIVMLAEEIGGVHHGFRYIQLPVNVMMQEAWKEQWQSLDGENVSVLEAAAGLGVGVFTSAPLMEGGIMNNPEVVRAVNSLTEVSNVKGVVPKLIQLARSTPYVTTTLVGHKGGIHAIENVQLSRIDPLDDQMFLSAMEEFNSFLVASKRV